MLSVYNTPLRKIKGQMIFAPTDHGLRVSSFQSRFSNVVIDFVFSVGYTDRMKKISFLFFVASFFCITNSAVAEFTTSARSAFLIDSASGAVIVNKAGDELMPPSSMLKLMTVAMAFDAVKDGRIKMNDMLPVSKNADYKNPIWARHRKLDFQCWQNRICIW